MAFLCNFIFARFGAGGKDELQFGFSQIFQVVDSKVA
jgi:hypothetical protein